MIKIASLFFVLFSLNAQAFVVSSQCPAQINVSVESLKPLALNSEIESDPFVKSSWSQLQSEENRVEQFKILTRTESALCVYTSGKNAIFLQTNNFQDELMINFGQNTYFRINVLKYSPNSLVLADDESRTALMAAKLQLDSDGGSYVIGEQAIAKAASLEIDLN